MTLYEMNQQMYSSLPELKNKALKEAKNKLYKYLSAKKDKYFMMLNNDIRYFTVFTYKNDVQVSYDMVSIIVDIAQSLGTLKAIEIEDNMAEFWITGKDNVCRMYALFPYDEGVIEV